MRHDMAKVIVERPRYGSSMPSKKKGYRKSLQRIAVEDRTRREPMAGRWHGLQRHLNEHLSPMKRFLRSRVGRPWNTVHQELCEYVSFNNAVQKHVLVHVFQFVHRFVIVNRGVVFNAQPGWRRQYALQAGSMYVCPSTGILKVARTRHHLPSPKRIICSPLKQYHWRENSWWEVQVRKVPDDPGRLWDIWLERDLDQIGTEELAETFGEALTAISKRVLKPQEVKQLYRDYFRRRLTKAEKRYQMLQAYL